MTYVELQLEHTQLQIRFAELQLKYGDVDSEKVALQVQLEQLSEQIASLEKELEAARRANKRQAAPFSRGTRKDNPKRPGRKPGHPGTRREKPDHVDKTLCAPKLIRCPYCGGPVEKEQQHENYQTEIPPIEPEVTRFVFYSARCPGCRKRVCSTHPEQTSTATGAAAHHLGPWMRALAADLKGRLGVPLRKIQEILDQYFQIQVSPGALVQSNYRLQDRAGLTLEAMRKALATEELVCADETGWRVDALSSWLWVVCSERFTWYDITSHRCATVVGDILGEDFAGWLMRDGWRSYDARLKYSMLRCLRHLQRNAEALEDRQSDEAAETMALFILWLDGVFSLKKQVGELSGVEYQEQATALAEWLDEFIEQCHSSSQENQKFAGRLAEIQHQIVPILEYPELPATNNLGERQTRPGVLHRKVSAGNKTQRGAEALAAVASLAASCRQQLISFADVVRRILRAPAGEAVIFWEQPEPAPS
ncbi:MAG: IS66 family transposase [bacterium]|nr:IS66 family transposase [bacterium]